MMRIRNLILMVALFGSMIGNGQEILTKEQAIAQMLANNYSIQLADQSKSLASVNASRANVGYHPTVTATAGASADYGSSNQKFQDGSEIQADANLTQLYNGSVAFNWTLYQGGERRLNLQKLYAQVDLAEVEKRWTIENEMVNVLSQYYQAAQALEQFRLQEELTQFSEERLERVQVNYEYARSNSLDVDNAMVDVQRDKAGLIQARMTYEEAKRNLLLSMGVSDMAVDFDVETEVEYNLEKDISVLIQEAEQRNVQLALIDGDRALLNYDEDILKARRLPTLGFNTDYSYSYQDFGDAGFFAQQQSNGVGAGLSLSWNIYDGGRIKNQKAALRVQMETVDIQRAQLALQLSSQLSNLYANYQTALELIAVESQGINVARRSFDRTKDEYDMGRLGQIEFRQSQINLLNAQLSERTAMYNAKLLELQIVQLSGGLLEEGYGY